MQVVEASFPSLIRTILFVIGGIVVLRFIGQLMNAKRNIAEEEALNKKQQAEEKEREDKLKNLGKTTIQTKGTKTDADDIHYQEL
jgi:hypothetical protein